MGAKSDARQQCACFCYQVSIPDDSHLVIEIRGNTLPGKYHSDWRIPMDSVGAKAIAGIGLMAG